MKDLKLAIKVNKKPLVKLQTETVLKSISFPRPLSIQYP